MTHFLPVPARTAGQKVGFWELFVTLEQIQFRPGHIRKRRSSCHILPA